MTGRRRIRKIQRGAVMSEFVLVLPILVLIMALVWFFGQATARSQRNIMMTRYETWRSADRAPGPSGDAIDNAQLNDAFFNNSAGAIDTTVADDWFADAPYDWWIDQTDGVGDDDASVMIDALLYTPGGSYRFPRGMRRGYSSGFVGASAFARRLETPVMAAHHRLEMDWRYTIDWRAGETEWTPNLPRAFGGNAMAAARDAFLTQLDGALLAEDNSLIQHLRGLYSSVPGYRGPHVDVDP